MIRPPGLLPSGNIVTTFPVSPRLLDICYHIELADRGVGSATNSRCLLCTVNVRQGRLDEAHTLLEKAREKTSSPPSTWEKQSLLWSEHALAAAERRWLDALSAAETAAGHYAQLELPWEWALALIEWAEIHLARGESADYERAKALYREALAIFQKLENANYANLVDERLRALRAKTFAMTLAHEKVTQELTQAGRIQESFLPEEIPEIPGWQISAKLRPARETSGDFYDFIHLPNGQYVFCS